MNKILIANLFFLMIPYTSFAQVVNGPQPIVETLYVNSGVADPNNDGEFLPSNGNWGFRVEIKNTSSRPISCLNGKFNAYLKVFGENCSRTDTSTYPAQITVWPESTPRVKIGPGETYPTANLVNFYGNEERIERGQIRNFTTDDKETLSYCGRDTWTVDCGYDCENGKSYNENWDETITGGSRKFYCGPEGKISRTSDSLSCNSGYVKDLQNDRCLIECGRGFLPNSSNTACDAITCQGNVAIGQARISPLNDGIRGQSGEKREVCTISGNYDVPTYSCFEDYRKEGESICVHKSQYKEYYLSNQQAACAGAGAAISNECQSAASRWCGTNYGYNTAFIQQLSPDNAGVGCYQGVNELAPNTFVVQRAWGPVTVDIRGKGNSQTYCKEVRGMDLGIINEWGPTNVSITCLREDGHLFVSADETSCKPGKLDENTMGCRAEAAVACNRAGFGTGILTEAVPWGLHVSCFNSGTYKLAPFVMK